MSTNWDWANTVQQPTTEQKQVPPTSSYEMNSWNAPQMQSPQEREAPAMMYQTGSPGARVDPYSPGNINQLQPVQTTGYQNYQLGGGQQFTQQQQHAAQYSSPSPPVSPVKDVPPTPPPVTNLALVPSQPVAVANPFDMFAAPAAPVAPLQPIASTAAPSADPFGATPLTPTQGGSPTSSSLPADDDFWQSMGFGQIDHSSNYSSGNVTPISDLSVASEDADHAVVNPHSLDERKMPIGGEYYKIRVTTPLLGAIFSSAAEVRNTLYKTASFQFVESIKHRPVVSFRIDGSAAETSGVGIGNVLMKVNDQDVLDTDSAVKLLSSTPRPMTLEFYAPSQRQVRVVKTEGQCMVKYDSRDATHPRTSGEWKPKYVVIGDLLGKPDVVYMYRSKNEYDIAVKEAQSSPRTLSVKVKQFDIKGARILKRGTVRYPNRPEWHYFIIMREFGLPIKISAESEEELAPVYDGIAACLAKGRRRAPSTPPNWMRSEQSRTPSPQNTRW